MRRRAVRTLLEIFAAVLLCVGMPIQAAAVQGITVADYSFGSNSNEVKNFWSCVSFSEIRGEYDSAVDADGAADSGSVHITTNAGSSIWANQFFVLNGNGGQLIFEGGTEYTVSMDIKSSADGQIIMTDGAAVIDGSSRMLSAADGWVHYEVGVRFTDDKKIYFVVSGGDGLQYWIDNIKAVKQPPVPVLAGSEPADRSSVAPSGSIILDFNNDMDDTTVLNRENYLLNEKTAISEVVKRSSKSYMLKLDSVMRPDTEYTLSVSGLSDIYGQTLDNFSISFRTERGAEPHILSTTPSDGAYNVQLDDIMTVVFDSEMDFSTATTDQITVNGDAYIESIMLDATNQKQIRIKFGGLDYMTGYTVSFTGIKGLSGEIMPDTAVSFTTQPMQNPVYQNCISESRDIAWPAMSVSDRNTVMLSLTDRDSISKPYSLEAVFGGANLDLYIGDESAGNILETGKYYIMSFYVKSVPGTETTRLNVVSGDNKSYIGGVMPGSEWKKYTVRFKAVNTHFPWFRSESNGSVLLDNIKIAEAFETVIMDNAGTIPVQCARNVETEREFRLVLNNSINECSVTLNGVPAVISGIKENTAVFVPGEALEYDTVYKLQINVTDEYGRSIELSREFRTEPVFVTDGIKLYSGYGSENQSDITNAALVGGRITARLERLKNNSGKTARACLIVSLFRDKKMIDARFVRMELASGAELANPLYVSLDIPQTLSDGEYTLSAFLWNGFEQIAPLLKKVEINS